MQLTATEGATKRKNPGLQRLAAQRQRAWLELANLSARRDGGHLDARRDQLEAAIHDRLNLIDRINRDIGRAA